MPATKLPPPRPARKHRSARPLLTMDPDETHAAACARATARTAWAPRTDLIDAGLADARLRALVVTAATGAPPASDAGITPAEAAAALALTLGGRFLLDAYAPGWALASPHDLPAAPVARGALVAAAALLVGDRAPAEAAAAVVAALEAIPSHPSNRNGERALYATAALCREVGLFCVVIGGGAPARAVALALQKLGTAAGAAYEDAAWGSVLANAEALAAELAPEPAPEAQP